MRPESDTAQTDGRWIGRSLRRVEDPRYLQGLGRYLADLQLPGMLHMTMVRSPHAHARVIAIRADAARAAPGVVAVLTAADLAGRARPLPVDPRDGARVVPSAGHPVLAPGTARYAGEAVAAIVAETHQAAVDARDLVEVDYEPLPVLVDPRAARGAAVALHEAAPDNVLVRWHRASGDVDGAFAAAHRVIRQTFHIPRLAAVPIETRGALAAYDRGTGTITLWCSAQDPHRPRMQLSRVLGTPDDRIRTIVPDVGGAFGSKSALAPEAAVAVIAAMNLGRPVRWIEDRRENLMASYQGRGVDADVEMAVAADGRLLAVRAKVIADVGAYLYPATSGPPTSTSMLLTGAYAIPAADVEMVGVATNKVPTGPYRGAGRPEAAMIVERMVDLAARELGLDPLELRRRNFIPPDRFPHTTPLGFTYDSGNYARALDRAAHLLEYDRWRAEQRRARTEGRLIGIGVATFVERAGGGLWESASVTVNPSGRVTVRTGSHSQGQGHETTFAQIAADGLGIAPQAVVVQQGDSAVVPRGQGTFSSRSITIGGSATVVAVEKIKAKATRIAAHLLEAAPEDIVWDGGRLHVRGMPARSVTFEQLAAAAYDPARVPRDLEIGLEALGHFALPRPVFPFGAHAAVVEIERETGALQVLRLIAVDDAGRVVNPLLAEGQVRGSAAQGLGQCLTEQVLYDESGQPQATTFAEYGLLRAPDLPPFESEFLETPSPINPLGAKGLGEAGCIGIPAAIANAVADALAPLGVRHLDVPFSPLRLWRVCAAGGQRVRDPR
jgi:carbon-monoxide dehydrogenase large subunit